MRAAKKEEAIEMAARTSTKCRSLEIHHQGDDSDDHDHVTEIFKESDLYLAAKKGNLGDFKRVLRRVSAAYQASVGDTLSRLSPTGNQYLHVAAKHGKEAIVNFIAAEKPPLVLSKNFNGENALHLAAKAGDESMVKELVLIHHELQVSKPQLHEIHEGDRNLLRAKNNRGNTALHEALYSGHDSIAEFLIQEDHEPAYYQNKDGESPLYLTAKFGFTSCLSLILQSEKDEACVNKAFKRPKSPIEAAIQGKHESVLKAMFDIKPNLIRLRDGEGRNPLHYAARFGYLQVILYLLNQYPNNATQRDKHGFFPIHLASIEGHVDVVRLLLQDFPDPEELLDKAGHNVLHLAAINKRSNIVNFVLNNPLLHTLINMKDKHGNTPLHLATRHWRTMIVSDLTWDKKVDIKAVNDEGMTAIDVAEHYMPEHNPQFTQRLTWAALKAAGTPRSPSAGVAVFAKKTSPSTTIFKDRVNILLIVSILVATVTFAAGITVPGGFNSSEHPDTYAPGMAVMLSHKAFHIFVFCDIIAMYCSIIVAVGLMWAQLGDDTILMNALNFVVPFYWTSLTMMSMAFSAGIFLIVRKLRWLSLAVLVMGIAFLSFLFILLIPLYIPRTSSNIVFRYISYYPFCLLVMACHG